MPLPTRSGDSGLFDHLIGADQQRLRDGEAQCARRLAVDNQLELRGLLDGEICRFGAFEY
jgi:hypothetical protein